MTKIFKNTIKSLLGVKGGKAVKSEPNPATMQRPKSVSLDLAPECICGRSIVSLLNIKGGKGKTSTVQILTRGDAGHNGCGCVNNAMEMEKRLTFKTR
jgi:hypothetical protein